MLSVEPIHGDARYYGGEANFETLENADGHWLGKGAAMLGLEGTVVPEVFDDMLRGHLPDGTVISRQIAGNETNRPGMDLTFGAPKSLSILALLGGDTRLIDAHNEAVRLAMLEVEKSVNTRLTRDGVTTTVTTGNMVAALYTHDTNREGEMHLHSHGLLFNVTRADDDKWHALGSDTRQRSGIREQVYDMKLAYGQFYREYLRPMVEDCGYTPVRSGPHGMYEFAEVPPDVIRAFSQRTAQIDDAVGRDASPLSRSVAALDTRKNKAFVEGEARREQWDKVLSDYDFDPDKTIQAARERSRSQATERGEAEAGSPARVTLTAEPALKEAITQALSSLSDKKAQFAYSEVLTAVVSLLPAEKDMVQRARTGIDTAIEQGRLVALDKDKGIFTSDIHVLDELTVRQFAREHMDSGRAIVSGEALLNGTLAAVSGVCAELAENRDPLAVIYGRGGAAVQRGRAEQLAGLAVSQGRQVMVLAADRKNEAFLGDSEALSGLIAGRGALKADLPLTAHTTVIVAEAETLGLKDSVFLMEKARESGAQILLMDSGKRQGTGSVLSVLQEEGAAHYRFNDAPVPVAQLASEADKKVRYSHLAAEYARDITAGHSVVAQVAGEREQQVLTGYIRDALREQGRITGDDIRIETLSPVWLDSKNRKSRDTYREGMVMERWNADEKNMERWRIDRVGAETSVLRLVNEAGEQQHQKISQIDASWSLFKPRTLEVAPGDRLRVTGREAKGKLKAQDVVSVVSAGDGVVALEKNGKIIRADLSRPLKVEHNYVESLGKSIAPEGKVLAALSGREMRDDVFNTLTRSGSDIRIFTAMDAERGEAKLARSPAVRVISAQVEAATGAKGVDAALDAARELPRTPAAQAVYLALSQVQHEKTAFQAPELLSAALSINSAVSIPAIQSEINRQVKDGELIRLEAGLMLPKSTFETEKAILRHIAEGKGSVTPLMASVPEQYLTGLTAGQQAATRMVLESADRFTAVQGYAGVGKTTQFKAMLAAMETLPEDLRPEVVGLAPTHRAVEEMKSVGVRAQTLESFIWEDRQARMNGEKPDYGNTLFLIDEASMIGNRAMSEAYQAIATGSGRAITSGDDAQLRAIEPGQPFRLMQQRSAVDTAIMKEIVRQTPELREVVYAMIEGQHALALEKAENVSPDVVPREAGAFMPASSVEQVSPDKEQAKALRDAGMPASVTEAIAADFAGRTAEARDNTLTVAHLNTDRQEINRLIHDNLYRAGITKNEQAITVLDPVRVRHNELRSLTGWAALTGKVALINREYWTVGSTDRQSGLVTLTGHDGREKILSPFENSTEDAQIYQPRVISVSEGDRMRFTRSDAERGYTGNSFWNVEQIDGQSMTLRSQDGQLTRRLDLNDPADRHTDLGYAVTAYGAQGASSRFVITLEGTEGGRKRMATKESGYVTLSRTKEHVQVYTDDRAGWLAELSKNKGDRTAHDYLMAGEDRAGRTAEGILSWASPLAEVAAGRALLKNYGLAEGESQGLFVPGVRRHPEPGLAFALWDSNGNRSGVVILTINADERNGVSLPGDFRVIGSSDARFAGIQQSRNGENRIAESLPEGLQLAQQYPDSGVIVRMEGDGLPLNISRITGADQVVDDSLTAQLARNVAGKTEDPLPFIPEPKENAEQEAERLARETLEKQGKGEKDIRPEDVLAAISEPEDDIHTGLLAGELKEDEYPLTGRDIAAAMDDKSPEKAPEAESQPDQSLHLKQIERDIVKEKSFED